MNVSKHDVVSALQDWYNWVQEGANERNQFNFNRRTGLCFAVSNHPRFDNMTFLATERDQSDVLAGLLGEDGMRCDYPFDVDADSYDEAYYKGTHHLNQRRIDWVLKTIKTYGGK